MSSLVAFIKTSLRITPRDDMDLNSSNRQILGNPTPRNQYIISDHPHPRGFQIVLPFLNFQAGDLMKMFDVPCRQCSIVAQGSSGDKAIEYQKSIFEGVNAQ